MSPAGPAKFWTKITQNGNQPCTPRSRPVTAAHLNENEAGSAHFQQFGNYSVALSTPVTNWKIVLLIIHHLEISEGNKVMRISGEIILEKVRRYRATASLYRQTAAFRPLQKWSLLEQAERWDRLAVAELEDYFNFNSPDYDEELHVTPYANERCEMVAAA